MERLIFDCHAHYYDEAFNSDREELLELLPSEGVYKIINSGSDILTSKECIDISKKYSYCLATIGIHPENADNFNYDFIGELENLLINNKVVGIGEIGLDYYWEKDDNMRELQQKAFIKQIEIANKYKLPIVIHTRDAIMDTLKILKEHEALKKGVFHCCPQNRELIKEALKLGYYISFAGPITFKNSKNADEMINLVPNDKILIETDSPYLAPEPVRGTRNTPVNVKYIAQKIASVKNISIEEVAKITRNNVLKIYGI